jgi:hypothetical protein
VKAVDFKQNFFPNENARLQRRYRRDRELFRMWKTGKYKSVKEMKQALDSREAQKEEIKEKVQKKLREILQKLDGALSE